MCTIKFIQFSFEKGCYIKNRQRKSDFFQWTASRFHEIEVSKWIVGSETKTEHKLLLKNNDLV